MSLDFGGPYALALFVAAVTLMALLMDGARARAMLRGAESRLSIQSVSSVSPAMLCWAV